MNTYYIEIVKENAIIDIAATKGNNEEEAHRAVTNAAIGRGFTNFSVRNTTEEAFIQFKNAKQDAANAAAEPQKPAEPEAPKPPTISINGGPKLDATTPEAQEALSKAAAELGASAGDIVVSFDGGPELPITSQEAEDAFAGLAPDTNHVILISAKPAQKDEPDAGNAQEAGTDPAAAASTAAQPLADTAGQTLDSQPARTEESKPAEDAGKTESDPANGTAAQGAAEAQNAKAGTAKAQAGTGNKAAGKSGKTGKKAA